MATIQTAITLYDGASAPLTRICRAAERVCAAFAELDAAARESGECRALADTASAVRETETAQRGLNQAFREGGSAASGLWRQVKRTAAAVVSLQGVRKALALSGEMQTVEARFRLVKGGDEAGFARAVMASAQRSRAGYLDTAKAVANLGTNGGSAFQDGEEIIAFTEQLNKLFVVSGTSAQGRSAAMLQITQAMGEGVLRGEELRSVLENAPALARAIERYMGAAEGSIKQYAEEGKITANVVKNALFAAADDTNAAFESLPLTWAQLGERIKNQAISLFAPILERLNELASSALVTLWAEELGERMAFAARCVDGLLTLISDLGAFIAQNWDIIEPILNAIAGFFLLFQGISAIQSAVGGVTTALSALLASPVTALALGFAVVVGVIYGVVAAINRTREAAIFATGVIFGAVAWLGALVYNGAIGLLNGMIQLLWCFVEPFIGMIEWILNVCQGGFDSFGGAVANLIGNIIGWFLSLGQVVTKIIDAVFGTHWTDGLEELKGKVTSWGKNENAITLNREAPDVIQRIAYDDAYDSGYHLGKGLEDKVKGMFDPTGADELNAFGLGNILDGLYAAAEDTAVNTAACADSLQMGAEDVKFLRDLAEREAINRFTTAEIRVEQYNENHISGDTDLDGLMEGWTARFAERLAASAEGVLSP